MEFGILSILPSILAIVLALATKNVFLALFASLLVGNFILSGYSLMGMLVGTKDMIVNVFSSSSSTSIIIILLTLGGMFYLIEKAGGLKGFTALMIKKRSIVKSRVGAELFTWLIGVLVFIDGTLSVMITGSISRPLTKAFGISPEKTAWIVHSTATPMSILVPIAAYGPYIASFIEAQGIENPTTQMVRGIGFNFYCIFAVLGVAVFVLLKKDFGPMKKAEAAYIAAATGSVSGEDDSDIAGDPSKAKFLLIPMVVMIVVTIAYIFYSGSGNLMDGDAETGLIFGIMAGTIYLIIAMAVTKMGSVMNNISTFFQGCGNMMGYCSHHGLCLCFEQPAGQSGYGRLPVWRPGEAYQPRHLHCNCLPVHLCDLLRYWYQCRYYCDHDAYPAAYGAGIKCPYPHDRGCRGRRRCIR